MLQPAISRLGPALDELDAILKLARACGVGRRVLLRPTLSRNAEVSKYPFDLSLADNENSFFGAGSCLSAYDEANSGRLSRLVDGDTVFLAASVTADV